MEKICDDELGLVLKKVLDPQDRKWCSEVCRKWWKIEAQTRSSLVIKKNSPKFLSRLLPRFPNLLIFEAAGLISDADLQFLGQTSPNLQVLNLKNMSVKYCRYGGIGDNGVCAVANGCHDLRKIVLSNRNGVGDIGVIALVQSNRSLTTLKLTQCGKITDQAIEAIARVGTSLQVLNLGGCLGVSDLGLVALTEGFVSRTLNELDIAGCRQITDYGVLLLQRMCRLEKLNLSCCTSVTDTGGVAVSAVRTLKRLNLSFCNISDVSLFAISQNCSELIAITLTGSDFITGAGIRCFAKHRSLERLAFGRSKGNVSGEDFEQTVIGSQSLKFLRLDIRLEPLMTKRMVENITKSCNIMWIWSGGF